MDINNWLTWGFYRSVSLLKIAPFLLHKLIHKDYKENRPALYSATYYSSLNAFFYDCSHIIDNIYLGSSYNASNYNLLESLSIKRVVNVSDNVPNFFEEDLEYYYYEIKDNGIEIFNDEELDNILKFIKTTDGNVLVHCVVGRSRSATIVLYYLMKEHNMTVDEAVKFLLSKRDVVNPSLRLIDSLKKLE